MSVHDEHSSFIKTPQQLITVVLLSFVVPIIGIILVVQLVVSKPTADPAALTPEAVTKRLQPVGRIEFGGAASAATAQRSGDCVIEPPPQEYRYWTCNAQNNSGAPGGIRTHDPWLRRPIL